MFLNVPKAPSLPLAPSDYSKLYLDQFSNVLRLYFNQIDVVNSNVLGTAGGRYFDRPYGQFYSTADQGFAVADTAYACTYNQSYLSNTISIVSNSRITPTISGVYEIGFSAQAITTNVSGSTINLWVRRDGADIAYSARSVTIQGNSAKAPIYLLFKIDIEAGEYIEIMRAATDTDASFSAIALAAPSPACSSVEVSVNFVAPIPSVRPT